MLRTWASGLGISPAAGTSMPTRISELHRRARAVGVPAEAIDEALDAEDPKQMLTELVAKKVQDGHDTAVTGQVITANPREMGADHLEACCALWAQESGDFVPAERAADFTFRPVGAQQILAERKLHNSLPDDARYALERWHYVLAETQDSNLVSCLALCRTFVRRCLGRRFPTAFGWPLNLLSLCGVVCDGNSRRRGLGSAVVTAAFSRLDELKNRQVSTVLFSTDLRRNPENEPFYCKLGAKKICNDFVNTSEHADMTHRSVLAGGAGKDVGDTPFVFMDWQGGASWEHDATIDLLGRGW